MILITTKMIIGRWKIKEREDKMIKKGWGVELLVRVMKKKREKNS